MQTIVLWTIYIILFVVIFALIAAATRNVVGVAWGFLVAAIVAMVVTGIVSACTCYGDMDFFSEPGVTCLGGIMILLLIIGIILVIAAYIWRYWKKKKCDKKLEKEEVCDDMSSHPSHSDDVFYNHYEPIVEKYQQKSVRKSKLDCSSDRGCKEDGSFDIAEKIRKRNRSAL